MKHKNGNTFRVILDALAATSLGRSVVVTCGDADEVTRIMQATIKMANTYLSRDFLTHAFGEKYMMANGGTITFLTDKEYEEMDIESFKPNTHFIHDQHDAA